jgi:hypothetical protein
VKDIEQKLLIPNHSNSRQSQPMRHDVDRNERKEDFFLAAQLLLWMHALPIPCYGQQNNIKRFRMKTRTV